MLESYKDVLKVEDVMDILNIGRNAAYKLVNNGEVKSIRIGRNIRIPKAYLLEYLLKESYNNNSNMLCAPMSMVKGA